MQSVFTAAYDEAFAIPTELSARTALRVQQVVAYETEVAQTADPLGGSFFVEALTDEMERAVRAVMDEIESRGGMVECLRQGWVQQRIAQRAYEHQRAVEKGEVAVVGVNKFATPPRREGGADMSLAEAHFEPDLELEQGSPEAARDAAERVRRVKRERDGEAARAALQRLSEAAAGSGNAQPRIRDAVAAYCTVGEIASVLKAKFGAYQPPTKF